MGYFKNDFLPLVKIEDDEGEGQGCQKQFESVVVWLKVSNFTSLGVDWLGGGLAVAAEKSLQANVGGSYMAANKS